MDNLCNCTSCNLNFINKLKILRICDLKNDLLNHCLNCKFQQCPTYNLAQYLIEHFPNFDFNTLDLLNLPQKYRIGICYYIEERYPIED